MFIHVKCPSIFESTVINLYVCLKTMILLFYSVEKKERVSSCRVSFNKSFDFRGSDFFIVWFSNEEHYENKATKL